MIFFIPSQTLTVLIGTSLLGLCCGVVGAFGVLKRRALLGDAVAHASLPGICVAFLLFHERAFPVLFCGAVISGLLSVALVILIRKFTKLKDDAAIAISLSGSFALGVTLLRIIQNHPDGSKSGLDTFIFGKAANMIQQDAIFIGVTCAVSIAIIYLVFKELKVAAFDPTFGAVIGLPVLLLDGVVVTLLCLCTVIALPAVGLILVSALLIFPAITARLWTSRLESLLFLSGLFGASCCALGTMISAMENISFFSSDDSKGIPTGPVIILCCALLFTLSAILSKVDRLMRRA